MQPPFATAFRSYPKASTLQPPAADDPHASMRRRVARLVSFGHRGSATENESRAAEYLFRKLKETGIDASKEAFAGSRSMGARVLIHVLVAMASLALLLWQPIVAAVLVGIAFISFIAEQMTRGVWLSRVACRANSCNVVGRVPAPVRAARRLVICAHYDTQKTAWLWGIAERLVPFWSRCPVLLKPPMLTLGLLMIGEAAVAVAATFVQSSQLRWAAVGIVGAVYAVFALLLLQWALGSSVPGATDNASGVAAVMKVASAWHEARPADDVELMVLFSGCEETGMLGAAAWADRHREELRTLPTTIINVDGIGFGPPRLLGAEVPAVGIPLRAPARLLKACAAVAAELGLSDVGPHALPGPTDGLAFLARGLAAVTVVGFAEGQRLPFYHTMADTTAHVDFDAASLGAKYVKAIVWQLARRDWRA